MRVEVYPRTSMKSGSYKRITQTAENKKEDFTQSSFFYIGNDSQRIEALSPLFQSGYIAEHFSSAQVTLLNLFQSSETVPNVIFVDVPFVEKNLFEFISFLKQSTHLKVTPVLYNKKHIINGYKDRLKKSKLVDDIVDLGSFQYNLIDKIGFLKEVKVYTQEYPPVNINTVSTGGNFHPAGHQSYLKRVLDIVLTLIAITLLLPVFVLIAIAIMIESRGPVFYNSFRAGRGFKIFKFYKFRTMQVGADQKLGDLTHLNQYNNSLFFKVSNDPRVTRIGAFLRKTSLDELPQLLNVLKGDMSLVGNRPLPLYEAATLTTNETVERFMAPAGMTGLWQIKKRGKENMSTEERINLDIDYARKHNLAYDLWIMANTPGALFQKSNV